MPEGMSRDEQRTKPSVPRDRKRKIKEAWKRGTTFYTLANKDLEGKISKQRRLKRK